MNTLLAVFVAAQVQAAPVDISSGVQTAAVRRIQIDKARLSVDDGDTVAYAFEDRDGVVGLDGKPGVMVMRLLGYDTPETAHPPHGIFYDQPSGPQAAARLKELVGQALTLEALTNGKPDKYGRLLAHLLLDGVPSGAPMVAEGLGYETISFYGDGGFPAESRLITQAWETQSPVKKALDKGEEPPFINPHLWRKINQHKEMAVPQERWDSLSEAEKETIVSQARELARKKAGKPSKP